MARSHACAASSVAVKAISCGSLTPGSSFFCSRSTCSRSASSRRCDQTVTSCPQLWQSSASATPKLPAPKIITFAMQVPSFCLGALY